MPVTAESLDQGLRNNLTGGVEHVVGREEPRWPPTDLTDVFGHQ